MPNYFLEIVADHAFNADLNLSFADTLLNDIALENIALSKAFPLTFKSESKRILIKTKVPILSKMSIDVVFKLMYDSFYKTEDEAILTLKFDEFGKVKQFAGHFLQLILNFMMKFRQDTDKIIKLNGDKLIIDLYLLLPIMLPDLPMEFIRSVDLLMIDFEPGMIKLKIQLENKLS